MLDFCLTIPYGAILLLGGVMGLLLGGSVESLITGGGLGGALLGIGWMSYQDYLDNKSNKFKSANYSFTVVSLILTCLVFLIMLDRYQKTGKMMPSGVVLGLSTGMILFYVYKLFFTKDVGAHAKRESKVKD